jgi:hypothetical protein
MVLQRLRSMGIRDSIQQTGRTPVTSLDPALERRLDEIERHLDDRIDRLIEMRVEQAIRERSGGQRPVEPRDRDTGAGQPVAEAPRRQWDVNQFRPYGGVGVGGQTQLVLGGRFDLGPVTTGSAFDLVPEVAFGLGDGNTTVLVSGNLQYPITTIGTRYAITPFVEAGGGVFSETVLALNAGYGASFRFSPGNANLNAFVEHQGVNMFDRNRFLFGLRLER